MSQNRLLACLADCAWFLNRGGDWPEAVRDTLEAVRVTTGVSRVWIVQLIHRTDDHLIQDYISEAISDPRWSQLGSARFHLFHTTFESATYRDLVADRIEGRASALRTRDLPDDSFKEELVQRGTRASAIAPIMIGGLWWGTLGLDECEREIAWSEDQIAFLRTVAGLVAGSIHRERQGALSHQFAVMERSRGGGLWELDLTSRRLWCSDTLFTMLGYPPPYTQMNMRRLLRHLGIRYRVDVMAAARACLEAETTSFRMDVKARTVTGRSLWLELITDVTAHASNEGAPLRMAGLVLDAGDRKARERELNRAALTDPLTGLPNRRAFQASLERALHDRRDRGAMLMLDLDHFKRVNDTLGHEAGDEVLRSMGRLLRAALKEGDLVARLGGEEFAVFLPRTEREARRKAELLRRSVEDMTLLLTNLEGELAPTNLTVSIGQASVRPGQSDETVARDLFQRVDRALYTAKRSGRNRVVVDVGEDDRIEGDFLNEDGQSPSRQTDGLKA